MRTVLASDDEHERRLILPDGRRLAWREYGDPAGRLIISLPGAPGSRFASRTPETVLRDLRLRLAVLDRPGYGQSDPSPGLTVADESAAFLALADALGAARFGVFGLSMGAPLALALAAKAPARVSACALVSPYTANQFGAPPRDLAALATWMGRYAPWYAHAGLAVGRTLRASGILGLVRLTAPSAERALLDDPAVATTLTTVYREVARRGAAPILADLRRVSRPWGFALEDVRAPVAIWHGARDGIASVRHARALATALPHATLHLVPEYGHLLVFVAEPDAMAFLAGHAD